MKEIIKKPRGTKDILIDEALIWHNLENIAQAILYNYGYGKIATPIFEETVLFKRGIGLGTDIVNKEMYTFYDQGNRSLTLRPEGTAGVIRSLIENGLYNNPINRLWYLGPMFRYERPQNGRQRQFHQLGIECIGTNDSLADFEIIYLAIQILQSLNINNLKLEVNSIGDFNERQDYVVALKAFLHKNKNKLDEDSLFKMELNPLRVFDSKNPEIQEILLEAPLLSDFLTIESQQHFNYLCSYLEESNIDYVVNPRLVRGLDYYTYTAFEIKSNLLGAQDTICGGGRYNHLVKQLNGPEIPAVGWGMGIERLLLLLDNLNHICYKIDFYIAPIDQQARSLSLQVAKILSSDGFKIEIDFSFSRPQKQIQRAVRKMSHACILIGNYEIENSCVTVKWLHSGKQAILSLNSLINIKSLYLYELTN
jgi:histidyl-tRNA synthetase